MKQDTGSSTWRSWTIPIVALPLLVIVLSLMMWVTALSRSGFWADDFLNVTHFARSFGDLSNDHINDGHYVINVFWAIGTYAFGAGSVIPFLLLNALVFVGGLFVWLWAGIETRWSLVDAWWIAGLFIATTAWVPTALWASNITHSGGFLALGAGLFAHERCMRARKPQSSVLWSLASGAAWTFAVVSNILYIGLLVIAGYCAFHQAVKIRRVGATITTATGAAGTWNLLLPILYFAAVAYPATTASPVYATNGLQFIHQDFDFYRQALAPTGLLASIYVAAFGLAAAGGALAIRRRDWFPIAVLGAAGATAFPALIQGQQRDIHYLAMPLLLLFSSLAAGARPVLLRQWRRGVQLSLLLLLAAATMLLLLVRQGTDIRSYFVDTPYGHSLLAFRSEVASLTPERGTICARLNLDMQHQAFFVAAMSGADGFLVPPISAAKAYLVSSNQRCPAQGVATVITVSLNARGDFVGAG
jgi:hypothetical protein